MQAVKSHSSPASLFLEQLLAAILAHSLSTAVGRVSTHHYVGVPNHPFCLRRLTNMGSIIDHLIEDTDPEVVDLFTFPFLNMARLTK